MRPRSISPETTLAERVVSRTIPIVAKSQRRGTQVADRNSAAVKKITHFHGPKLDAGLGSLPGRFGLLHTEGIQHIFPNAISISDSPCSKVPA